MNNIIQFIILVLSGFSIYCLNSKSDKIKFYGAVVGIIGQPFWLWTSWNSGQWAIGILSLWYMYSYYRGIRNFKSASS